MSGDTMDKMHIALVGEFSRFSREQYAKRIEALGGVICEPCNGIDYIFYGKLPKEEIEEYKYGIDTVFGAYNEIALLDKLTEVEMDKQDQLPLSRIKYYQTLPTQPDGCTVFMYEVRRMAQELAELRQKIDTIGFDPIIECGPNSFTLNSSEILKHWMGLEGKGGVILPGTGHVVIATEESIKLLQERLSVKPAREIHEIIEWDFGLQEPGMTKPYPKAQFSKDVETEIRALYETLSGSDYNGPINDVRVQNDNNTVLITFRNGRNNLLGFNLKPVPDVNDRFAIPVTETSDELQAFIRGELAKKVNIELPASGASVTLKTPSTDEIKNLGFKETFTNGANTIDEHNELVRDALRWRGLMASPAIRLFGSAGLKDGDVKKSGYAHFGGEFWTIHSGRVSSSEETVRNRKLITQYADIMAENEVRKADQWIMLNVEENLSADAITEVYFEGEELRMTIPANEVVPKNGDLSDQVVILQNAQIAARERGIWQPVTLRIVGKKPKE